LTSIMRTTIETRGIKRMVVRIHSTVLGNPKLKSPAQNTAAAGQPARVEAVQRMVEFGEKHHLSLGEPITRKLLHEGHRF
jgi:hypothetical protein